jgi:hypothetical protein
MSQLITLSETSTDRYLVVVLPKDARYIDIEHHDGMLFLEYFNPRWTGIKLGDKEDWMRFELLGSLTEIKEDIAREMVEHEDGNLFTTHLEYLHSLVESKGVSIKENVIILIKCKK